MCSRVVGTSREDEKGRASSGLTAAALDDGVVGFLPVVPKAASAAEDGSPHREAIKSKLRSQSGTIFHG